MPQLEMPSLLLIVLALLGVISSNNSITISAIVLLLIRVVNLHQAFPWIEQNGLTLGITILTIGILSPLASGTISVKEISKSFLHWHSIVAIAVGVLVAYLGGRGVHLMSGNPTIVTSLVIGTIIGVALLKGVPVGPLIAAGILSMLIEK